MMHPRVIRQFEKVPVNPSEADFHGPYNKLLNIVFPPDSAYTVVPQYTPTSREAANWIVMFDVLLKDNPVFILKLKQPDDLLYASSRAAADRQVRACIWDLNDSCPLPALHAVSAMGTRLCFYHVLKDGTIEPPLIPAHPERMTDTALRDRWDCDILKEEGAERFQALVEEIKQRCAALEA